MSLDKSSWRAKNRQPKEFSIEALDDTILVRPMTALRHSQICAAFADDEGVIKDATGFRAAVIADSVVDEAGAPIWNASEVSTELDLGAFLEVVKVVSEFTDVAKSKNSVPASGSPSV